MHGMLGGTETIDMSRGRENPGLQIRADLSHSLPDSCYQLQCEYADADILLKRSFNTFRP